MGFRNTYRPKVGPFTFNFNKKFGLSSATVRLFGVTYRLWSKKQESGLASVDFPGMYSYRPKSKNKAKKETRQERRDREDAEAQAQQNA